ncbi:MAG: biotin--[acetyl-CoA-carboxylase] ligase [Nitrospirae bacterium]|nr:MAG: biotin--[acetyl-CoA-carboxylase] ligase [Nitrospirota bacterium]
MASPTDSRPLTKEAIQALLQTNTFGRTLHVLQETASTNGDAMTLAQQGAEDGTVVVAERQTAGKGRLGRRWYSPPGDNLYCSVILRRMPTPVELPRWLSVVPLMAAVAVARAVQTVTGLKPSLKWPNDILVGDRKLGGLLCESSLAGPHKTVVVIGIGLNVNTARENFPEELREIATSLASETGRPVDRASLLASLLSELETYAEALLTQPLDRLLSGYARLCSTLGRRVRVHMADGTVVEGLAESLAPDGSLRIARESASGKDLLEVRTGDIIHLR